MVEFCDLEMADGKDGEENEQLDEGAVDHSFFLFDAFGDGFGVINY